MAKALRSLIALTSLVMLAVTGCAGRTLEGTAVPVPPLVSDAPADYFRVVWSAEILDQTTHQLTRHRYTVFGGSTILSEKETFTSRPSEGFHVVWLMSADDRQRNVAALALDELTESGAKTEDFYPARGENTLEITTEGSAGVTAPTSEPLLSVTIA